MSSSEDESDFQGDDSGSDGFEASPPKKSAPKGTKAKTIAAAKIKAPAKPKAAPKVAAVKKVLQEHHSNDSDDDVRMAMPSEDDEVPAMAGPSKVPSKKKTASETYTKLSQLEHILKRPDTYIGSVESLTAPMWVYDEAAKGLAYKTISYVPGLYKIVDEILVNAADNKVRDATMSTLRVEVDREAKTISVYNDGAGIPVEMHSTEKVWIPELIFGHLLTSSNYDDNEAKVTGGRNGYGAKLANIYSTEFIVETACSKSMKKYKQVFSNNMSVSGKPKITDLKKEDDWTKITFTPDLVRFGMTEFDDDLVSLIYKRVYDMAGITKGVRVYLNDKKVTVTSFKAYVGMYVAGTNHLAATTKKNPGMVAGETPEILEGDEAPKTLIIHEKFGTRWEIAFAVSEGQFQQVSYCNAIATTKGGAHVNYIVDQIVAGVAALVKKKNKGAPVKPHQIKSHLSLFVNCLIDNPSFDSQTKENMTLIARKFGSTCVLTEEFLKKIAKSGVIENILSFANFKAGEMLKKTDGKKRTRVTGLVKLEDANMAGGKESNKCTLILTEGDSAKALVVSGFGAGLNRDYYGVYPLRGKLLNVRDANLKSLKDNAEIVAVKQIMGLQQDKKYDKTDSLRYGSIMIMADQDHDGSHIKGLIINFLDFWFPTLLKIPGFLVEFITPIVKVTKGKKSLSFFTIPQYELWKEETDNGRGWDIKYFKGLGTSTAKDAAVYFNALSTHKLPFQVCSDGDRELIDKAFNKKRADDRKTWLAEADPDAYMDHAVKSIPIADFVNKELILFSIADCVRSIPSVVDGFKPGQRKVLFGCFLKKMQKEVKVAQLSGFIGEKSAYHHGEVSLQGTIIGLAQTYLGSNNINLLLPNGQFGTRLQGGKDAASARYIFTNLHALARIIFQSSDDNVLAYLNDDGYTIEPKWYVPILPMVLVNGSDGIGTGWSSTIPSYNPTDMVDNLKRKMAGEELVPIHPWYRGFKGTIEKVEKDGYKVTGVITQLDEDTIEITELPIRLWTQSYKETLEAWVIGSDKVPPLVKDYKEYHTDRTVHFIVTLTEKGKAAIATEGLEKTFKLNGKLNTSNMVCFDPAGKIKKYATTEEILLEFYDVRMEYYHKRKAFLVAQIGDVHRKLTNQARFIKMIIDEKLKISKKKRSTIVKELIDLKFDRYPKARKAGADVAAEEVDEDDDGAEGSDSDYDYLLSMSLSSLTAEKVAKLLEETLKKEAELTALLKLSAQDLWVRDLDTFTEKWQESLEEDIAAAEASRKAGGGKGKGKSKKRAASSDEDDLMDDEEFDYKPVKKVRAPVVVKKSVPLPDTDDEAVAIPVKVVAKVAAAKPVVAAVVKPVVVAKPVVQKKRASSTFNSDDEEVVKAPKVVKKKPKVIESDDEMEEDIYAEPAAWPPRPSPKSKPKPAAVKPVVAKVVKPKPKAIEISDSEDDLPEVVKKAPVKKAVVAAAVSKPKPAAKKAAVLSEDEDDIYDVSIVAPKPRRAAIAKKATYVDLDLDSDEPEASAADNDSESGFEESD